MSQTTQSPQTADFAALEVGGQLNDSTIDYMQPISGSEQSDLGAYLAAPQPMTNAQGSSTPSRIGAPAPDDAPLLMGDTGVEYGPDISFGAYTQRLLGMGASVPINGIKNFAVGLWDMGAAIFRPSESLSNETNFEYLDIDGSGTYPEPGSGLTFDKLEMALSASINQSNENIRIAEASGNDWSVGWELGNHPLIQATGVGEFAGLSLLSKAGGLVSSASIFNRSTRAEDVFNLNTAASNSIKTPNGQVIRSINLSDIAENKVVNGRIVSADGGDTITLYRKVGAGELQVVDETGRLPKPRPGKDEKNKFFTESADRAYRFVNEGGTSADDVIVAFKVDAKKYNDFRQGLVPKQGSKGSNSSIYETEGLGAFKTGNANGVFKDGVRQRKMGPENGLWNVGVSPNDFNYFFNDIVIPGSNQFIRITN